MVAQKNVSFVAAEDVCSCSLSDSLTPLGWEAGWSGDRFGRTRACIVAWVDQVVRMAARVA